MRYTFTNEITKDNFGEPQAVFQMWMEDGFGPWKKKSFHGKASKYENGLKKLYIYFSSDEDNKYHGAGAYCEERIDMNEFRKFMITLLVLSKTYTLHPYTTPIH